jgi:hypothetical protein
MNRDLDTTRLPEPVERYFREVATMQPPAELMDDVLERIEATSAPRRTILSFAPIAAAVLSVAVIGAGVWALSQAGPVGVPGPGADESPIPAQSPTAVPAAASPDVDALPRAEFPMRDLEVAVQYPLRAAGHGSLWISNWDLNTIVRWDPGTGVEQARIDLGRRGVMQRDQRDAAILVTDEAVYAAAPDDRIVAIDPATNDVTEFASGVRAADLATDGSTLWVVDLHYDEVVRFDLATGDEIARILMPDSPSKIDLSAGDAWVVSQVGILVRIDGELNDIAAEYEIGAGKTYLDVAGDAIFISGMFQPLEHFSIRDSAVVRRGANLGEVQLVSGRLVGLDRQGHLAFLDPQTLEWTSVIGVGEFHVGTIVVGAGGIWVDVYHDPDRTTLFVETGA